MALAVASAIPLGSAEIAFATKAVVFPVLPKPFVPRVVTSKEGMVVTVGDAM